MLERILKPYQGLSREIWFMALTTLINRAGAMVVPFLALYLTNFLNFTADQVAWIMSSYGVGSGIGVLIGGRLADKIGYYKVMYFSLLSTAFVFFGIQFLTDFYLLCLGIFLLTLVSDTFRPAVWVAIDDYTTQENRTRSVTLIRLAINLGFSVGPALGGLLITYFSYSSIFWVDGLTCLIAAFIIIQFLHQKTPVERAVVKQETSKQSPYHDIRFLVFWFAMFLFAFAFMQFFSTMPLYFSQILKLDEDKIGLLLALNGLLIFLTEMPIVHALEKSRLDDLKIVIGGFVLLMLSFLILNFGSWIGLAIGGIVLMTFGEMFGLPFSNSYALDRAKLGSQGAYMALYSLSFSIAHTIGPNFGIRFSARFGFESTWYLMAGICLIAGLILFFLQKKEQS